jgi:putative hydrolase of the HAD superfamily
MKKNIEAIFLDVGNTLRILLDETPYREKARERIVSLLDASESPGVFCEELDRRYKIYRKWAFENLTEASEKELWSRWMAPEFPANRIEALAHELSLLYRQSKGRRVNAEGGKEVVIELYKRGYTLGIISNVITTDEIPEWLEADGLSQYFKSVVLSSVFGRRKPHPSIYVDAALRAGVQPANCVYVGDNFSRDVQGTRAAGFGMVIILPDLNEKVYLVPNEYKPDLIIHKLGDLLDIFPDRTKVAS